MQVSRPARFWWLLKRAFVSVYEDGCLGIAKGAAYSGLLSFFPVITTVALILVTAKAAEISDVIARFLFEVVPPGTKEMVMRRFTLAGERPVTLVAGALAVSLWAASGLFLSLIEGFNAVYKLPTNRSLVRGRLVAIALSFCCAAPALGASAMIIFGARTEVWVVTTLGMLEQGEQLVGSVYLFGRLTRYVVALVATWLLAMLLYKIGPARHQRLRYLWPGAIISTAAWFGATLLFSWYVRNIADYNVVYGSMGAVIALLLWMYLLSLIILFGCAYNAEYERLVAPSEQLRP